MTLLRSAGVIWSAAWILMGRWSTLSLWRPKRGVTFQLSKLLSDLVGVNMAIMLTCLQMNVTTPGVLMNCLIPIMNHKLCLPDCDLFKTNSPANLQTWIQWISCICGSTCLTHVLMGRQWLLPCAKKSHEILKFFGIWHKYLWIFNDIYVHRFIHGNVMIGFGCLGFTTLLSHFWLLSTHQSCWTKWPVADIIGFVASQQQRSTTPKYVETWRFPSQYGHLPWNNHRHQDRHLRSRAIFCGGT